MFIILDYRVLTIFRSCYFFIFLDTPPRFPTIDRNHLLFSVEDAATEKHYYIISKSRYIILNAFLEFTNLLFLSFEGRCHHISLWVLPSILVSVS